MAISGRCHSDGALRDDERGGPHAEYGVAKACDETGVKGERWARLLSNNPHRQVLRRSRHRRRGEPCTPMPHESARVPVALPKDGTPYPATLPSPLNSQYPSC